MKKIFTFLSITLMSYSLSAQDLSLFKKEIFIRNADTLRYRILYPENYVPKKKYPVITFLHGSGERGNDNESQLIHGGRLFVKDSLRKAFRAIIIFPQLPKQQFWNSFTTTKDTLSITGRSFNLSFSPQPAMPALLVKLLLDSLIEKKIADQDRMYIGGLSLGGFGTFDMLERYPDFFAAAFPICGGGDTTLAGRFAKTTSVWIFHGDNDSSVDVKNSREYFKALKNVNADVRYNEYPGVGHNSWDNAFAEKDLMPWLFSKKKKNSGTANNRGQ